MSLRLGRITGLNEPNDWSNTGDTVTLTGSYLASSLNDGLQRRDQLLGLLSRDEPIIPVIIDGEARVTGFYRVLNVQLLTDIFVRQKGNLYDYQVDLQRIGGFQSAYMESFLTGALMVNGLSITTTAEPFHAYGIATDYTIGVGGFTNETRATADGSGSVVWVRMNPTAAAPTYKSLARFTMTPANYYAGACEIRSGFSSDHVVVGQQESPQADNWTMRNGLVSITLAGGFWPVTWADATNTYRTTALLDIKGPAAVASLVPATGTFAKIIRNAPEECILRVPLKSTVASGWPPTFTATAFLPAYMDVAMRRGSRIIRFYLTTSLAGVWTWGFRTAVASSAITGGLVSTTNDANGNRVGVFSSLASTNDLVNGRISITASLAAADMAVAMELGGTGSTNRDTIASQVLQYVGGGGGSQAERMQVVGR